MALTKVEEFLFKGNRAHFVKLFKYEQGTITVNLVPVESNTEANDEETTATFNSASVPDVEKDSTETDVWPLDIIGFDCYAQGKRWQFVLNCSSIEWSWESDWPTVDFRCR